MCIYFWLAFTSVARWSGGKRYTLADVVANDASELGADDPAVVGADADADDAPEPGAVTDPDAQSDAYAHRAVFALHVGHRVLRL